MPKFKISTPTHTHVPALLEQIHALAQHHNDVPRISQHQLAGLIAQDEKIHTFWWHTYKKTLPKFLVTAQLCP